MEIPELWNNKCTPTKICLDPGKKCIWFDVNPTISKGDFVMWDSRTVHCNHPAKTREFKPDPIQLRRLVAYVCMTPVSLVPADKLDELRKIRVRSWQKAQTSTHWPHEYKPSAYPYKSTTWKQVQLSEGIYLI